MKLKITMLVSALLVVVCGSNLKAQYGFGTGSKIMEESGNLATIKAEKVFNIQYDYSGMAVGKFKSEEEYVKKKKAEYNEKEPGKGDKWHEGWVGSRKDRFQPKFEDLMNKTLEKKGMKYGNNPDAKYTLIVKTTFTEPGYNIGISKYPAFCNFDFIYVETANPTNVVAKLYVQNVIGSQAMGFDYDTGSRISESYAKAGKMLAKYLMK